MNTEIDMLEFLIERKMYQSVYAFIYAKEKHHGQFRSDRKTPYFTHPLSVANILISNGIVDDEIIATAFLHDVIEDCGVTESELRHCGFSKKIVSTVVLLSRNKDINNTTYFNRIYADEIASLVKIADRCHNLSTMGNGFSKKKIIKYIHETREFIYPHLFNYSIREKYPNFIFMMTLTFEGIINSTMAVIE